MDISFNIRLYKTYLDSINTSSSSSNSNSKNKKGSSYYKILHSKNNKFYFKDKNNTYHCKVNGTYYNENENSILYSYFTSLKCNQLKCSQQINHSEKVNYSHYTTIEDLQFTDIPTKILKLLFTQLQLQYIDTMMKISTSDSKMVFQLNILFLIIGESTFTCNDNSLYTVETINFYYDIVIKEYSNLYTSYPIKGNLDDCYNSIKNYSKTPLLCYLI